MARKMVDWDQCWREGTTPWDYGRAAPPLLEWLEAGHRMHGAILVPGAGSGHDAATLALHHPEASVIGCDISPTAIERARSLHQGIGNLTFREADIFRPGDLGVGAFDWIFEHTCFCAIDPGRRDDYARSVTELLRPGGRLLAVFFLDPYDDEHAPGGGPPHGASLAEIDALFAEAFVTLRSGVPENAFPGRERRELVRLMERK